MVIYVAAPGGVRAGPVDPASVVFQFTLAAVSFPIKIVAARARGRAAALVLPYSLGPYWV